MGKRGPKKGVTYTGNQPTYPKSVQCKDCNAYAPTNQSNGNPMGHFDQRVPDAHNTGTYCKMESYK